MSGQQEAREGVGRSRPGAARSMHAVSIKTIFQAIGLNLESFENTENRENGLGTGRRGA